MKKQIRNFRSVLAMMMVAALFGTLAATPTMANTNPAPVSAATNMAVDEAVGSGGSQMEPAFKTWGNNNRLSIINVVFATGKNGTGKQFTVYPGGGTPQKIDSFWVPRRCKVLLNGLPLRTQEHGYWRNNQSMQLWTNVTVYGGC